MEENLKIVEKSGEKWSKTVDKKESKCS